MPTSDIYRGRKADARLVGWIDDEGQVLRGDRFVPDLVGWVDQEGHVLRGNTFTPEHVGFVSADNEVRRGDRFSADLVGWVNDDGQALQGDRFAPQVAGETEPPSRAGAAALLLLFDDSSKTHGFLEGVAAVALGALVDQVAHPQEKPSRRRARRSEPAPTLTREQIAMQMVPLRRVVGVAHADAHDVFWAIDPNTAVATIQRQSEDERPHRDLNDRLAEQRHVFHDGRPFIVVVGGDSDYLLEALRNIEMADLFICCGEESTLSSLDIPLIDRSWRPGNDQMTYKIFHEILQDSSYSGRTAATVLTNHQPAIHEVPGHPPTPNPDPRELLIGDEKISMDDARAIIAGYCFGELPGRWDTRTLGSSGYAGDLPDITWRRWAYRVYDCVPPTPKPDLEIHDLLMPVALNVTQGYGSQLLERLLSAAPLVSQALTDIPAEMTFWNLDAAELHPDFTPKKHSTVWALNRAWAILMSVPGCGVTVTHKILHHKWPTLFPLIDTLTLEHLRGRSAWSIVHSDLTRHHDEFQELEEWFASVATDRDGVALTRLRLHDILLWCRASHQDADAMEAGRGVLSSSSP